MNEITLESGRREYKMGKRDPPGIEKKERAFFLIVIPFVTHICDLTFNRKARPPPIAISSFL